MSENECVICHKQEYTASEPIAHYVCDECSERHAAEEQEEFEREMEDELL